MPAAANGAEYIAFGAMDRYFICILRLDGALIDTNAVKTFVGTT